MEPKRGVPSHFRKGDGRGGPLRVEASRGVQHSVHAQRDPDALSAFERELKASGKYRCWANRRANVCRAVRDAHVVGLCEATTHTVQDVLHANTHLGLAAFGLKKGEYDGSAILVDGRRISVLQQVRRLLTPPRVQILLAALLEDRETQRTFWFVVLHLKSDGAGPHGGMEDVRVQQAERSLAIIDRLRPAAPVVIVGDLNSDRFLYPAFDEAGQRHVMGVFHGFECALPLVPTYHHWSRAAFDHILLRGASATEAHVPSARAVCPNARQGSDHLPTRAHVVVHPP